MVRFIQYVAAALILLAADPALAARCLYVSSYHAGYQWNDDIERGMQPILEGQCELRKFYMDGKRRLDADFARRKALEAMALIKEWRPDVIIAADDNAAKYLVMPHLRNAKVPVVFCGINWTGAPYGLPYRNTTGMIEVGPIEALVREVRQVVKRARQSVFLSADEITQYKEYEMSRQAFRRAGVEMRHVAVRTMAQWEAAFLEAQDSVDFLVLGNNAGINDWDRERGQRFAEKHSRRFVVAYLEWMAPYSMLAMAKIGAEQGEWSAKAALMILQGTPPNGIPVVANRRWNMYVNPRLLDRAGFRLSPELMRKAIKVNGGPAA